MHLCYNNYLCFLTFGDNKSDANFRKVIFLVGKLFGWKETSKNFQHKFGFYSKSGHCLQCQWDESCGLHYREPWLCTWWSVYSNKDQFYTIPRQLLCISNIFLLILHYLQQKFIQTTSRFVEYPFGCAQFEHFIVLVVFMMYVLLTQMKFLLSKLLALKCRGY
jgi:hypothetical protein